LNIIVGIADTIAKRTPVTDKFDRKVLTTEVVGTAVATTGGTG
jgi:hypothetical protein